MESNPPPRPKYVVEKRPLSGPKVREIVAELGAALGGIAPVAATAIFGPNFLSNPFTIGTGAVVAAVSTGLVLKNIFYRREEERYLKLTGEETPHDVQLSSLRHGSIPIRADGMKNKKHDPGFIQWLLTRKK